MTWECFVNWTVSIDCGSDLGIYQGQIQSVDEQNQRIQLKNTFHNGILLQTDDQHSILIDAKTIRDLNLLSQPNSNYQIAKTNSKKFHSEQQLKVAPIAANQNFPKKNGQNAIRSTIESTTNESEVNETMKSCQIQEKYRCDQMILQHNNGPIDYEQILLPFQTTKKYLTDEGLVVPAIDLQLRHDLFSSSESFGYSLERRIESMGRCTNDMCLHLLGGTQRLLVKNRHQHPTIVVLATTNDLSGVYAICAARILATKNIRIYLYLSPNSKRENLIFENEFKLIRTTQTIVTNQVNELPRSPVDLVLNGLDGENRRLNGERWYQDVIDYCSRLQTSIIGVDPSIDSDGIECKYSLIPLLPLLGISSKYFGRLYLCDLAFGSAIFQKLNIRYSSPFGAKSFVALHEN